MTAEFYALKGLFLTYLSEFHSTTPRSFEDRVEEANKAYSAAVQFHDNLFKGWALWGEFLESAYNRSPTDLKVAASAITCFLHASRCENEMRARKYIARVFWLLSFEGETRPFLLSEAIETFSVGVPSAQWLAWIPQLLTCLVKCERKIRPNTSNNSGADDTPAGNDGKVILNLLNQIGKQYPQAVYLPVRTLYLTLRIEQRGRHKRDPNLQIGQQQTSGETIRATEPMLRCSRILQTQRDFHPTVLVSLEGIVDQMMWFRENWYEEVLRQLRQALAKCYAIAFETSANVSEAVITPHLQSFVRKLVSTFGLGVENLNSSSVASSSQYTSTGSESLARRALVTVQDPVFHKLKGQFTADFDFSRPGSVKLHNLIHKLKKWIKILEARIKLLPKWFLIEEKCRFLGNFSVQTADVELPGEYLLNKNSRYYIRIARFLPKVDIVNKHGSAPRRLHIRGHNGRVYPYLVVSDSTVSDSRREERLQQLLRMINCYFMKQKESSRRFMHMYVSRVVAFSPQNKLVEDNLSSISLMDVYRRCCKAKHLEPDTPITRYYERLAGVQARGKQPTQQVYRDIMKEVQSGMVPRTMLTNWAVSTFPNATCYWTFRKMVTMQLGVLGLMEYVLQLNRLYPEMLYIHQDSGLLNVAYYKFQMDDSKGELDGNKAVPFRLTPNLAELCTSTGVAGPLTAAVSVAARVLASPSYRLQAILKAILRDEIIIWQKRQESAVEAGGASNIEGATPPPENEVLVNRVNKATEAIMSRIKALANVVEHNEHKSTQLVRATLCVEHICRMDPAWHPWL